MARRSKIQQHFTDGLEVQIVELKGKGRLQQHASIGARTELCESVKVISFNIYREAMFFRSSILDPNKRKCLKIWWK